MVTALLLLGGGGTRFGHEKPKQFHLLGAKPLYQHALHTLQQSPLIDDVIIVCHPDYLEEIPPHLHVIPGGKTRQESSYLGLLACHKETSYVLIHDAARPFLTHTIIEENITAVKKYLAVDTCIPSADTLVHVNESGFIKDIPPRSTFQRGQTPQTFSYDLILKAHQDTQIENATDDCQLVLSLGNSVKCIQGSERNMKITTTQDLLLAEQLLQIARSSRV